MFESDTMFNERDQRCTTVHLMLSTDPSYDNRTIAIILKMQIWIATNNRDVPRVMKTKFPAMVMVFGVVSSEGHIMPPHIFEVSLKVNTKMYLDMPKRVMIPWCNQVAGGRPWVRQQDSALAHNSKETRAWLLKECYDFAPFVHCPSPRPEAARLLRLVIRREHHQQDLLQHQSLPDRHHSPSIRRAPAGTIGKGMYSILSALKWRPIPAATRFRLCSRVSSWVGVFARSAMSSA